MLVCVMFCERAMKPSTLISTIACNFWFGRVNDDIAMVKYGQERDRKLIARSEPSKPNDLKQPDPLN